MCVLHGALVALVIVLQLIDAYLTIYGIKHGLREGWAPMQWLIARLPPSLPNVGRWTWLFVAKVLLVALVIALAFFPSTFNTLVLCAMAVLYAVVVARNGRLIHERQGGGG